MKPLYALIAGMLLVGLTLHYFQYKSMVDARAEVDRALTAKKEAKKSSTNQAGGTTQTISKTDAMLDFIRSDKYSFNERDRMVWAIGNKGDASALPALKSMLTGKPCDHSAGANRHNLCQHELLKAINKLEHKNTGGLMPDIAPALN